MAKIQNIKMGNNQVNKIYVGENINWIYEAPDITAPTTNHYPTTSVEYDAGREVYFEVDETCFTYYTLDGSPVSEASTLYTAPIVINEDTTINYFSIDLAGNAETPKTASYNIKFVVPTTVSISPSNPVQTTIPFNVTITSSEGKAIYYRLGTGTQQTYTAPFPVNQSSAGVYDVMIPVYYWGEGEAEQSIIYDTNTAIAGKPVVTATAGNNQVALSWGAVANATSYSVYRSTALGTKGALLLPSEYQTGTTYTDTTAANGTTYYYTVTGANYANGQDSDQATATPNAAAPSYRYVRIQGYGDQTGGTTRIVELEAMENQVINRLLNLTPMAGYAAPNAGTIGVATNGAIVHATGYPLWWTGAGTPNLVYDLGAAYPLDSVRYVGYSPNADPRQTKFKIYVSTNNIDWVLVIDNSLNTTVQPEAGFSYPVS